MRAVVQRVSEASVQVENQKVGSIGHGILVLLGVGQDDLPRDAIYMAEKVVHLRIFADAQGKMNRSLLDVGGGLLAVSQFTLWGDCRKGRRPSFIAAAEPSTAEELYEAFVQHAGSLGVTVATGQFQEMMEVSLVNDGPVTLLLDSKKVF
ncbi:MAG: D-tyrosyl-tRNA(Tyr) deacylase [Deltaproteobacteria bacterium]|nr:MAG: D-tyrosyl-tRNA(Tyr) deacylase [Deltaproteobacteria bacterium]